MSYKLLFVCLGNICRSPSAENIMNHLIQRESLEDSWVCDSAGTSSYHIGSPPDRRMNAAAQRQGITLRGQARQFERSDFETFDLILAMDRDNYDTLLSLDASGQYHHKIKMICQFATHHTDISVPDPYYGGRDGFDYVIELLLDACEGLLQELVEN